MEEMEIILMSPATFIEAIAKNEVGGLPSVSAFMFARFYLHEEIVKSCFESIT